MSKVHLTKEQKKIRKKLQKYYKDLNREERRIGFKAGVATISIIFLIQEFIKGKD